MLTHKGIVVPVYGGEPHVVVPLERVPRRGLAAAVPAYIEAVHVHFRRHSATMDWTIAREK